MNRGCRQRRFLRLRRSVGAAADAIIFAPRRFEIAGRRRHSIALLMASDRVAELLRSTLKPESRDETSEADEGMRAESNISAD